MPGPPWPVDAGGGGPASIRPVREAWLRASRHGGAPPAATGGPRAAGGGGRRGAHRGGGAARPSPPAPGPGAGADVATPIAGATPLVLRRRLGTGARLVRSRSSAAAPTQVLYDRTTPVGRHSRVLSGAAHDAVGRAGPRGITISAWS